MAVTTTAVDHTQPAMRINTDSTSYVPSPQPPMSTETFANIRLPDLSAELPPAYDRLHPTTTTTSSRYARRPSSVPDNCTWADFRSRMLNGFDPRLWSWIWVAQVDPRHINRALTPEHWAAGAGDIDNVLPPLDKDGKKPTKSPSRLFKGNQQLCLHMAAAFGRIEVVKMLLQSNAVAVDYDDIRDQTALYIAVKQNETEIVKLLLDAGWSSTKVRLSPQVCENCGTDKS